MNEKNKSVLEKLAESYKPISNVGVVISSQKTKQEKKILNKLQSKNLKPETTLYDKDEHIIKIYDGVTWHICTPGFVLKALKYRDKLEAKTIYDDLESTLET